MITRDLVLKVGYTTAVLEEPLDIYIYDRNILLIVDVIDYDFKFGGSFENLIGQTNIVRAKTYLRSPKGEIFTHLETNIVDNKVEILITELMTDENEEIGEYTLQIQVFDEDGSSMFIHPFKFYVHDMIARTNNLDFDAGDSTIPYVPESSLNNIIKSNFLNDLESDLSYSYDYNLFNEELDSYQTSAKTTIGAINELKRKLNKVVNNYNKMVNGNLDIAKYKEENNLTTKKGDSNYRIDLDINNKLTDINVINKRYNVIEVGSYYLYKCAVTPNIQNKQSVIKWFSSNEDVAIVNSTGKVMGISQGFAIITVYSIYNPNVYEQFRVNII